MFKNWKTSLFGILAGGANLFAHGVGWKQVLLSLAVAGAGLVAKDHDISGVN